MLSTKIDPKEPGKFIYRKNRWKHIDGEELALLKIQKGRRHQKIADLKHKFYFRSKPKFNVPQIGEKVKLCKFSKNSNLVPYLSTTPNEKLRKEAKIKELCNLLTSKEIELVRI